jgi:hypothetical protein
MNGTSIHEGLVKPVCDANSRYPEFMFMPAFVTLLNYLGGKVRIKDKNITPSIFLCMIGRKGRVIKSSSARDAIAYLKTAGIACETGIAEGRTMIFTPASAEGLGSMMMQNRCTNPLMLYDELSSLVGKVGIDSSSLGSRLLTLYEGDHFANQTKVKKEQYSFVEQWSMLAAHNKGMDERFYFLYQPETLKPMTPQKHVDTMNGVVLTQKRIATAVTQGTFEIEDPTPLEEKINQLGNRCEIRAEKFALAFAVDLGRRYIDDDCIERGLMLANYEKQVKRYLGGSDESVDKLAAAQNALCRLLQKKGAMTLHQVERQMNARRYSTETWGRVTSGLVQSKRIKIAPGSRKDQRMVQLLESVDDDES